MKYLNNCSLMMLLLEWFFSEATIHLNGFIPKCTLESDAISIYQIHHFKHIKHINYVNLLIFTILFCCEKYCGLVYFQTSNTRCIKIICYIMIKYLSESKATFNKAQIQISTLLLQMDKCF